MSESKTAMMFELVLVSREDDVENVSDALVELDALSVSVEDADADTPAEQALFGEPGMPAPKGGWQRSVLRALYPDEASATDWRARVASSHASSVPTDLSGSRVDSSR